MEIILVSVAIVGAWILGYRRGRRVHSVTTMSTRDLRRALKKRK